MDMTSLKKTYAKLRESQKLGDVKTHRLMMKKIFSSFPTKAKAGKALLDIARDYHLSKSRSKMLSNPRFVTAKKDTIQKLYVDQITAWNKRDFKRYLRTEREILREFPKGPKAAEAYMGFATYYQLRHRYTLAAKSFLNAIRAKSRRNEPIAWVALGILYMRQKRWKEAMKAFKKVIRLYPYSRSARTAKGLVKYCNSQSG